MNNSNFQNFFNAGSLSGVILMAEHNSDNFNNLLSKGKSRLSLKLLPLRLYKLYRMQFPRLFSPLIRIPAMTLIGLILKFILDLGFGMVYRYYELIRPVNEYIGAIILTVLVFEGVLQLKKLLNRRFPWEKSPTRRLGIEIMISTLIMLPVLIGIRILISIFLLDVQFIQFSDEVITAIYYLILLIAVPAFTEFAIFLVNRYRTGLAEVEKFRKENAEFQFETLRTQVNPHFLFNSLNTLSSLVYEDREKAVLFIRHMSDVYRYVLENRSRETISLREEIVFIRAFVYLYELRFDKKLTVEININEKSLDMRIAPMTLQLLIENAVKHNIVSSRKPLQISVFDVDGRTLTVSNNLQRKPVGLPSTSVGLKNIISRYGFLSNQAIEIVETETEYKVSLPLI
ncbi:MAG: two-component system [Bacteroidetes bacterium]|nr:MAG: two-component system [Bacteroidota bacterium]